MASRTRRDQLTTGVLVVGIGAVWLFIWAWSGLGLPSTAEAELIGRPRVIDILRAVAKAGLDAAEAACVEVVSAKLCGRDVLLNILARQRNAAPPCAVATPAALRLAIEPAAECARYDPLRHSPLADEAYHGAA